MYVAKMLLGKSVSLVVEIVDGGGCNYSLFWGGGGVVARCFKAGGFRAGGSNSRERMWAGPAQDWAKRRGELSGGQLRYGSLERLHFFALWCSLVVVVRRCMCDSVAVVCGLLQGW